ncbi:hypothetical protein [Vreelandella populi]|uniref:hypothetical protein n=1 Tax=Vreelandella populi TaxID=2498858 RepID=UPI000F8F77F5|nr:hypothetical protein [Halomonas populi]RUR38563.1 hypothetical protein ELY25_09375 [Halomonas populi]
MKLLVAVVLALVLAYPVGAQARSDATKDSMAEVRAQRLVRESLRDGRSAEFRALQVIQAGSGGRYVCGEVNSKNAFGGYSGHQRFIVIREMVVIEEMVDDFEPVWRQFC